MDLLYFYFFIPLFFDWLLLHLKRIYNAGRRKKKLISRRRAHTHAHTKSPIHTHTLMQSSYMYTNFLLGFHVCAPGTLGPPRNGPAPLPRLSFHLAPRTAFVAPASLTLPIQFFLQFSFIFPLSLLLFSFFFVAAHVSRCNIFVILTISLAFFFSSSLADCATGERVPHC